MVRFLYIVDIFFTTFGFTASPVYLAVICHVTVMYIQVQWFFIEEILQEGKSFFLKVGIFVDFDLF
jgi:hypothetical protein